MQSQFTFEVCLAFEDYSAFSQHISLFFSADDEYDWPITDDNMVVIWARGQKHLYYTHNAVNGLDICTVQDYFFYRNDVPMYHGFTGQRGVTQLNFHSSRLQR